MLKAIKHLERMGKLDKARALLGKLAPVPISQCWRTFLEGAVLDPRASQRRPRAASSSSCSSAMVWPCVARGHRI